MTSDVVVVFLIVFLIVYLADRLGAVRRVAGVDVGF
jgi:hypothetical protein